MCEIGLISRFNEHKWEDQNEGRFVQTFNDDFPTRLLLNFWTVFLDNLCFSEYGNIKSWSRNKQAQ